MNPWLITWESMSDRAAATIHNRIAAILPNRRSESDVTRIVELIYANHSAFSGLSDAPYVFEQVRFARRKHPYKAVRRMFPEISCGANPFLFARPVFNLTVEEDADGYQILRWEEPIYPYPPRGAGSEWADEIYRRRPFPKRRMVFYARTNGIDQEPDGERKGQRRKSKKGKAERQRKKGTA